MLLKDSQIPEELKIIHQTRSDFDFPPELATTLYQVIFTSVAAFLRNVRSEDKEPTSLSILTYKGQFIAGAISRYAESETEGMQGGWELDFTFNEEDLADSKKAFMSTDVMFHKIVDAVGRKSNAHFATETYKEDCIKWTFQLLADALDANAKPDEKVTIEVPNLFVASVKIEGDEKVKSITADNMLRQVVKNDDGIQTFISID